MAQLFPLGPSPNGRFRFSSRSGAVDFRALSRIRLEDVEASSDPFALKPLLSNLVYCDASADALGKAPAESVSSLVRALQLTAEYGMHVQTAQQAVIDEGEKEVVLLRAQLQLKEDEGASLRAALKSRREAHRTLERMQHAQRAQEAAAGAAPLASGAGQLAGLATLASVVPGGPPKLVYRCALCPKAFRAFEFLEGHVGRRHPGAADSVAVTVRLQSLSGGGDGGSAATVVDHAAALAARDAQVKDLVEANRALAETLSRQGGASGGGRTSSGDNLDGCVPARPNVWSVGGTRELSELKAEVASLRHTLQTRSFADAERTTQRDARVTSLTQDHASQLTDLQHGMRAMEEAMREQEATTAAALAHPGTPAIHAPTRLSTSGGVWAQGGGGDALGVSRGGGGVNDSHAGELEDDDSAGHADASIAAGRVHAQAAHDMIHSAELAVARDRILELEHALHAVLSRGANGGGMGSPGRRGVAGPTAASTPSTHGNVLGALNTSTASTAEEWGKGDPTHRAAVGVLHARLPPSLMGTPAPPPPRTGSPGKENASPVVIKGVAPPCLLTDAPFVLSYAWQRLPDDASSWGGGSGYKSMSEGEQALPPGTPQAYMWATLLPADTQVSDTSPPRVRIPGEWTLELTLPRGEGEQGAALAKAVGVPPSRLPPTVRVTVLRSTSVEAILSAVVRRIGGGGVPSPSLHLAQTRPAAHDAAEDAHPLVTLLPLSTTVEEAGLFQYRAVLHCEVLDGDGHAAPATEGRTAVVELASPTAAPAAAPGVKVQAPATVVPPTPLVSTSPAPAPASAPAVPAPAPVVVEAPAPASAAVLVPVPDPAAPKSAPFAVAVEVLVPASPAPAVVATPASVPMPMPVPASPAPVVVEAPAPVPAPVPASPAPVVAEAPAPVPAPVPASPAPVVVEAAAAAPATVEAPRLLTVPSVETHPAPIDSAPAVHSMPIPAAPTPVAVVPAPSGSSTRLPSPAAPVPALSRAATPAPVPSPVRKESNAGELEDDDSEEEEESGEVVATLAPLQTASAASSVAAEEEEVGEVAVLTATPAAAVPPLPQEAHAVRTTSEVKAASRRASSAPPGPSRSTQPSPGPQVPPPVSSASSAPTPRQAPAPDVRKAMDIVMSAVFGAMMGGVRPVLPGVLAVGPAIDTSRAEEEEVEAAQGTPTTTVQVDAPPLPLSGAISVPPVPPLPSSDATTTRRPSIRVGGGSGEGGARTQATDAAGTVTGTPTERNLVSGGEEDEFDYSGPLSGTGVEEGGAGRAGDTTTTSMMSGALSPLNDSVVLAADEYEAQAAADAAGGGALSDTLDMSSTALDLGTTVVTHGGREEEGYVSPADSRLSLETSSTVPDTSRTHA